jgi:hypothetical protein
MKPFQRGLSPEFIKALRNLSDEGWWRDVLDDDTLIIGIRHEYLDVYWRGQSIFSVTLKNGRLDATTHPKYLLDPALSKRVGFDGHNFDIDAMKNSGLIHVYEDGETLGKLKKAAGLFTGPEKSGVHDIVTGNDNVVDVEIAMSAGDVAGAGVLPRADIATFEKGGDGAHLCFWEAKTFYNPELRTSGEKNVISQMERYKTVILHHREPIIESYTRVAGNLQAIADMSGGRRRISKSIRDVAQGAPLTVRQPVDVGLIVFGFDAAQKKHTWEPLKDRLAARMKTNRIKSAGEAKKIRL